MEAHKYILSIAGFDPSSGAGLTSDIKTFQAHGLYGLSVCTSVTNQNDISFKDAQWVEKEFIIKQIKTLFERFTIPVAKIGIVENWQVVYDVLSLLKTLNPDIKIVLDPILQASAGFSFHSQESLSYFEKALKLCDIITPNYDEIKALFPKKNIEETVEYISEKTDIYLKGGHRQDKKGWDELYHSGIVQVNIEPEAKTIYQKHGSGCVLSSAIASNLALEIPLEDACKNAKYYTERFLNSHNSLLGIHSTGIK
ncbi:hydroxymethylpyrimidine/phosphomethylpyrimidine kinase [Flavivirga aquatica]|uniref:hydroxymethylpyrimidine kinase n=1 Tax=Flavivirga aquatica TaxID=1849968 RepID=A0A1E5T3T9_9FLAO|nr:hydroxymethylpyrimidine/phosphomethylpyrimidine kinase [Flavivirga aquatica]OEK06016.1 hydroxymethylpyrimidine/phosphomethylpyrimidine kinase [Flavivirga aquatica]